MKASLFLLILKLINFSIFSLNIKRLPAKFHEFQELIQNVQVNKSEPDVRLTSLSKHPLTNLPTT